MAEIVLEEDDCLKLIVEADPGDVRVCFREKENGPYGWFDISACWHEVDHLEKALSLVKSNDSITGGGTPYRECAGSVSDSGGKS